MERSQNPNSVRAERNSFSSLHRKRYLGSSRSPPQRTSPESCGKNVDQSQHTSRFGKCTSDLEKFRVRLQKRSEGWRPYTFRAKYSVNSHAFVREATLTISVKILPRRLNLPNGSRLYYKTINCEKTSAFCSVTTYHPTRCLTERTPMWTNAIQSSVYRERYTKSQPVFPTFLSWAKLFGQVSHFTELVGR